VLESTDVSRHCPAPAFVIWPRPGEPGRIQYSRQNCWEARRTEPPSDGKRHWLVSHCSVLKVRVRRFVNSGRGQTTSHRSLNADCSC
jgi:hypothetical protein